MQKIDTATSAYSFSAMALVVLAVVLWAGVPAGGQNMPSRDNDTRGWQIADMDKFLDSHPEIGEQLRKDPSLIKNDEFIENHPALQQYLQEHPGIREEFTENPKAFMRQEQRYERREDQDGRYRTGDRDVTREELANTDRFLDSHPEIAEQLRKDPSLIKNREFVEQHPALGEFLQSHPGVREEFTENPNAFMHQEQRYDRREDDRDRRFGDRDTTRAELAKMDGFLDGHPEIAEQLRKDPSLIKNREFVEQHPALGEFLQSNPEVREEFRENPNAFMHREERFDRREDFHEQREMGSSVEGRGNQTSFGQFLGGHSMIAQELSKDPSLANNEEFLASHADLRDYLKAHPEVKEELAKNPQAALTSAGQPAGSIPATPKMQPPHKQ
jgi:GrpB-like predicted nucleotidyltransferase (UPF0157 family)